VISTEWTHIGLYSWGEPFLHPRFEEMIEIIAKLGFGYSLSTNASTPKEISDLALTSLHEIKFSMPGFSQESYDRQHGFDFSTIKQNIEKIVSSVATRSSRTSFSVIYHVYKSNCGDEFRAAADFCRKLNMKIDPIWAIRTGFTMPDTIPLVEPNNFRTDIWDKIYKIQPADWKCPQYEILVIDEFSNVVQCCVTDRYVHDFIISNIKEVDFENLRGLKEKAAICQRCIKTGIGFLAHVCGGATVQEILKEEE